MTHIKPYTYLLISETSWYIGVRVANKVPASEDIEYMSSSEYIKKRIAAGEVFVKTILGEYNTREEASAAEDAYLREYWGIPGRVNKARGYKTYEFDEEVRTKLSASCKAAQNKPEIKAKRSAAMKVALASPEARAKLSASAKVAQNRPEVRAKKSASMNQPETRAKKSASMKDKNSKQCTIDGITIYPSRDALVDELGQGKSGSRHPNFKYI